MANSASSNQPDYIRIDPGSITNFQQVGANLVGPINRFNEQVSVSMNGALQFGSNVAIPVFSSSFTTPSNYAQGGFPSLMFAGPYSGISAVIIGRIVLASNTAGIITNVIGAPQWTEARSGQVTINYIAGLEANTKYNVTFFVV